ncbi:hypothetical protein STCU_05380 [Strigomonas culicis]|uniref:Uncharacterized protein n=1 Tax=Strigomonas culicis TaxID=28005 RepID=S9UAY2_9TRYP|nr:hypothetical protein STCU_09189 [Strigomonas culicis]EPY27957.1 hypothetical protein STCU_05380 [Strigomonas culicis]|eukprot:EPY20028.1 hypothetical protein STCU_09189 [Strigomonas culicis]
MTQKLLLAEGLDLLHQCEVREYDTDRIKQSVKGSRSRNEIVKLVKNYEAVYHEYVRGLEILNHVRHQTMDDTTPANAVYNKNLAAFCTGKMTAYMDRCDNIQKKLESILLPLDQVDLIGKEGCTAADTLFIQDGTSFPLNRKENTLARDFTLADGTYILTVKNKDDYSLASPSVEVTTVMTPPRGSGAEPSKAYSRVPCQCAWRKVFGVCGSATLQFQVSASGMRDSHIDVLLQRWTSLDDVGSEAPVQYTFNADLTSTMPAGRGPSAPPPATTIAAPKSQPWVAQLPALPDDELATLANYNVPKDSIPKNAGNRPPGGAGGGVAVAAAAAADPWATLESLNVPNTHRQRADSGLHVVDPIEVNPAGFTCAQRLDRLGAMLDAWPAGGCAATHLPMDKQRVVQGVYALPYPSELS